MPLRPEDFQTGGALQGVVAASLLRQRDAQSELAPGAQVGIYRVLRELARGGMAIVYLAERADGEYEQRVALKWMQSAQAGEHAETLFRRERQALADLRHPHIARLLDGGRSAEGRPWFAMEYIEGEPLDRHCITHALPLEQRLTLFLQVCSAVAFAHARGVIHRDIKPSNVLVDADGSARLLDFGIAQLLGEDDSLALRAYTPGFASPEQQRGETLTVASDVFQLGRLLAALCSQTLDERDTIVATVIDADAADARPLPGPAALPPDLAAILHCATAADAARRYATADALAADVRAFLGRRPVAARPRSASYVARRYAQRHPLGVVATVVALIGIVIATAYFTDRIRDERDAASYQARVATSVLDFLQEDLLAAADPGAAPGRELTVREALDLAASSADQRFRDTPLEHSAIRVTLSNLYRQLGRGEDSVREARHAVDLLQLAQAPQPMTLPARLALFDALFDRGRMEDAAAELAALSADAAHWPTPDPQLPMRLELRHVQLKQNLGEFASASVLSRELLARAEQSLGADHLLTLAIKAELAGNLQMLGQHDEALTLRRDILARHMRLLGRRQPTTLDSAGSLAVLLRHRGEADEAASLLAEVVADSREVRGPLHPATLMMMNELATALQDLRRYDEAEPLFTEVLESRLKVLGEENRHTRNSMSNLGLLHSLAGNLQLAAPLYERVLEIETRVVGATHPDTLALLHNIAGLYRRQQRIELALSMHQRAIAGAQANVELGPGAWQTALFRVGHALTLESVARHSEADAEMGAAIAALESALGTDHARTLRARAIHDEMRQARTAAHPG